VTRFDRLTDRYQHDNTFRALVDALQGMIVRLEMGPSEIREAAMFASCLVEMRHASTPALPGWRCPCCQAWNGEAKELLTTCRVCVGARPFNWEVDPGRGGEPL
jgi:hypothetical protein